jgi:hypothetical protein
LRAEAAVRLRLPYGLLSDTTLEFTRRHRLPTFTVAGPTLLRRLTLILDGGRIEHAHGPIYPPAADVLERLHRWRLMAGRGGVCPMQSRPMRPAHAAWRAARPRRMPRI